MSHIPEALYRRMADDIERLFSEEGFPAVVITSQPDKGFVRLDIPPDCDKRSWYDLYSDTVSWLEQAGYQAAYQFEKNDPNYGNMYVVVYPRIGV